MTSPAGRLAPDRAAGRPGGTPPHYAPVVIEVSQAPTEAASDPAYVAALTGLINRAYDEAERGLWREPAVGTGQAEAAEGIGRTDRTEVAERIGAGGLLVASTFGRLTGAVFTSPLADGTWWFGALAVEPASAGLGLGNALVAGCEQRARQAGATSRCAHDRSGAPPAQRMTDFGVGVRRVTTIFSRSSISGILGAISLTQVSLLYTAS